jgi:hypothetical protein
VSREKAEVGLAYYYFDYQSQDDQTASNFASCLARQIAGQMDHIYPALEDLYTESVAKKKRPSASKLLTVLCDMLKAFFDSYIIIDALDESDASNHRTEILSLIWQLKLQNVKIMVTSRPDLEDIEKEFQDWESLKIDAKDSDIETYLSHRIKTDFEFDSLTSESLKKDIVKQILQKVNGR